MYMSSYVSQKRPRTQLLYITINVVPSTDFCHFHLPSPHLDETDDELLAFPEIIVLLLTFVRFDISKSLVVLKWDPKETTTSGSNILVDTEDILVLFILAQNTKADK